MTNCEKNQELISRMIDGDLTGAEQSELREHIAVCPECQRLYDAFSAVSGLISDDLAEPPSNMKDNIMWEVSGKKGKITPFRRWRATLAAAACLALVLFGASKAGLFGEGEGLASLRNLSGNRDAQSQAADTLPAGYGAMKSGEAAIVATLTCNGTEYAISDTAVYEELCSVIAPAEAADAADSGVQSTSLTAPPASEASRAKGYTLLTADGKAFEIILHDDGLYCREDGGEAYLSAGSSQEFLTLVEQITK